MKTEKTKVIELRLKELTQLFNSMDPSPFHVKDLDHDAEEFIVSWAQDYPAKEPLSLRIHLEQPPAEDATETVRQAIHNYFDYRAVIIRREFRHLMKQAQTSLAIGLVFLAACLSAARLAGEGEGVWSGILGEGLTIIGWVAMWRPVQLYLYDWWPLMRQIQILKKISAMPVEVVSGRGALTTERKDA